MLKLNAKGDVPFSDVKNFLPNTMKLNGHTYFSLNTDFTVDKLMKTIKDFNLNRLSAKADLKFKDLAFDLDTIHAATPELNVSLVLPAARFTVDSDDVEGQLGTHYALNTHSLGMKASVRQSEDTTSILSRWNPNAELTLDNAMVRIDHLGENIHVSNINFLFDPNLIDFKSCTFRLGQSDMSLQGRVIGIEDQMEKHGSPVKGEFKLNTDLLDVKEIVELITGLGLSDDAKPKDTVSKESGPFIVPAGIDLTIDLKTKKTVYGSIDFNDLRGLVTMKDHALILQEMSFTNKAAEMQLSALYQSLNRDSLFFAMDFHLLDVQISDLLHMVPYFDTLVPMLRTFDGQAEFNIDVETNLWPSYQPKVPTMHAAADIKGKNLTVNDEFTFTKITDMLLVSTDGEYRVDSLDVQLSFFNNKLDLWPSQIGIGKYKAVVEGYMTSEKYADFHIAMTESPIPLPYGLKIWGPFEKLKFELEKSKYPNRYKPIRRSERKQLRNNLKKRIAERKAR